MLKCVDGEESGPPTKTVLWHWDVTPPCVMNGLGVSTPVMHAAVSRA